MINQSRSDYAGQYGLTRVPLMLDEHQSAGDSSCVGSVGHSKAMADSGTIWHQNSSYPAASFNNDICYSFTAAGENVGKWGSGDELKDLQSIHNLMMNEQHDPGYCSGVVNHACNIVSGQWQSVGIGIVEQGGQTWLTEDFIG
jgi:uncharacterized protein YkwD